MMKKTMILTIFLALALSSPGCQNTVNTVENQNKHMTPTTIQDKRFITDGYLADRLELQRLDVTESNGLMQLQVSVKNARTGFFSETWSGITGENPYNVKYKITWFRANGMAINSILNSWTTITINPGETTQINAIAPEKGAKDFLINIMEAE